MASNSTGEVLKLSVWSYISLVSFFLVLLVGIIGNALVCYVFGYKRRRDRSVTETLYFYLGVVDLMTSVITPSFYIYGTLTFYKRWDFGLAACKIFVPLVPITTSISAGIILMIGLDRYRVIVTPFKRHFSRKQVHIGLAITIILSFVSYLHYIIGITPFPGRTCQVPQVGEFSFSIPNVVMLLSRDAIFLAIFVYINVKIYLSLNNRERSNTLTLMTNGENPKRGNEIRVLITVGVLFIALIFPADLTHLTYTMSWLDNDGIPYSDMMLSINAFAKILHVMNSCVNVFVYSRLHSRFRDTITDRFTFWRKRRSKEKEMNHTATWQLTSGPMEQDPFLYIDFNDYSYSDAKLYAFLTNCNFPETNV